MKSDEISHEERQLLESLDRQLRKARRQGATLGGIYSLLGVSLIYTAIINLGWSHPVSALCYGGVAALVVEIWRRLR